MRLLTITVATATVLTFGETTIRGGSHTHIGWNSRAKHRFVFHRRGQHMMAFHMPRHRFVIRRHGRRFVAFNEPTDV